MPILKRLIIRPGGIGDTLLLAPALFEMKRTSPERSEEIWLAGYTDRLQPLLAAGLAHRAISLDGCLYGGDPGDYDRIDSFFHALPEAWKAKTVFHAPFPPERKHVARWIAGCLGATLGDAPLSVLKGLLEGRAADSDSPVGSACAPSKPRILIHPGAGSLEKRWPLENFLIIAEAFGNQEVCFLLGEAEEDLQDKLAMRGCRLFMPSSLMQAAAWFMKSDVYVGNDAGMTHLAGLLGLRTFALFGPSDEVMWSPWGEDVHVIRSESMGEWASPAIVIEAIKKGGV